MSPCYLFAYLRCIYTVVFRHLIHVLYYHFFPSRLGPQLGSLISWSIWLNLKTHTFTASNDSFLIHCIHEVYDPLSPFSTDFPKLIREGCNKILKEFDKAHWKSNEHNPLKVFCESAGTTTRQKLRKLFHQLMHLRPGMMGYIQCGSRQCTKSNAWICAQLESPIPSDPRTAAIGNWDIISPEAQASLLNMKVLIAYQDSSSKMGQTWKPLRIFTSSFQVIDIQPMYLSTQSM